MLEGVFVIYKETVATKKNISTLDGAKGLVKVQYSAKVMKSRATSNEIPFQKQEPMEWTLLFLR